MAQAEAALGEEKTQTRHMHLGLDAHALTFPVAGGALLNVVAFVTDPEEWPYKEKFTAPANKAEAIAAFKNFNPAVRAIMDLLPDNLDKWAVFDYFDNPAPTYVRGRVCISGDAAHASAPYHGAGAGFCIEDAAVLAALLDTARQKQDIRDNISKSNLLRAALDTYDAIRRERNQWLVESSRYVGEMYEWRDPGIGRDFAKIGHEIDWRSHRIWDFDVAGMMTEAEEAYVRKIEGI